MEYSSAVDWPTATQKLIEHMAALPRGRKQEVAAQLGISPSQWSQFTSGKRGLTPERAHEIAAALGIELNVQVKLPDGRVEE